MADNQARLQEIANRGLQDRLPPDKRARFDEAVKRGLIQLPASNEAATETQQPAQEQAPTTRKGRRDQRREANQAELERLRSESQKSGIPLARDLQEIGAAPELNELSMPAIVSSLAANFTFDSDELGRILNKQVDADVQEDAEGNFVAKMPSGEYFAINKPGLSGQDIAKGVANIATFGKAGAAQGITRQAVQAAGTQAAIETGQTAAGGDFGAGEVALAAGGVPIAAAAVRGLRATPELARKITDKFRANQYLIVPDSGLPSPVFEKALRDKGLDFGAVIDDVDSLPVMRREKAPGQVVDDIIKHKFRTRKPTDGLYRFRLENGNVVDDDLGAEAFRQGFRKGDVASAKVADQPTKSEMLRMLRMKRQIESQSDLALDFRPSDVVGDNAMERFRYIRGQANRLRDELNAIAKRDLKQPKGTLIGESPGIKGLEINPETVTNRYFDGLDDLLVIYDDSVIPPKLDFTNSLISEDKTSQRIINSVTRLLSKDGPIDALKAHDVKKQLDSMLDFNKNLASGLTDVGKKFAKNIRHSLNQSIREVSPKYARVNDDLSMALSAMDDFDKAVGPSVDLFSDNASQAAGQKLNILLTNYSNRTNVENALTGIDNVASELGGRFNTDIRKLIQFDKALNDRFGETARRSFQGGIESALTSGPRTIRGKAEEFALNKAAEVTEELRGINDTNAFNVMERILRRKD